MENNTNAIAAAPTQLSIALQNAVDKGYTAKYKVIQQGLTLEDEKIIYSPAEVKISNFYRFEGYMDPDDRTVLYLLEAMDGNKGTVLDAYGIYADPVISDFITRVEAIQKQVTQ